MIPAMQVVGTRLTLLLHIPNLAARGDFTISSDDAATAERREADQSNETHGVTPKELSADINGRFDSMVRWHATRLMRFGSRTAQFST